VAIYYLDIDDEITSAAARLRDSSDTRIALVLSVGSRVATSRINFRLLAREARKRNKRLAIIAADPTVQSVARSAELPVYANVGEYEKAEAALAATAGGEQSSNATRQALDELALTVRPGTPPLIGRAAGSNVAGVRNGAMPAGGKRRGPGRPVVAASALLLVAIIAAAGYFFLPGADVVLTLREDPVGPLTMNVTVDPAMTAVNAQTATVPGLAKAFPVEATATFNATGQKAVDTPGTGTVTFTSLDTISSVTVITGTRVATPGGVAFLTTSTVTVPPATVSGSLQLNPGKANAPVQAVKAGTAGNVAAGAITRVPSDLAGFKVSATNKSPTTGGTHTVSPLIQQSDIDGAQASMQTQLASSLQAALQAPGAVPSGSTVFGESARLGDMSCDPDPAGLLNSGDATFQLDCKATGSAIVASQATLDDLVARRAAAAVKSGYALVDSSVSTTLGQATVNGSAVVLPMTIRAGQVPVVDLDALRAGIEGKSTQDAQAFLEKYGKAEVTLWPGWTSTVPGFDFRIDIHVVDVSPTPGGASPSIRRTAAPGSTSATATPPPAATETPGSPAPSETATPTEPPPTDTPAPTDTPSPGPSPS
jgi:Baseplate J-like protein